MGKDHSSPTLHMICGKIAAGKSTLAAQLSAAEGTVLIAEDTWLAQLFGDRMSSGADYMRCSAKLRAVMGPHIVNLLDSGLSVVLDFQANTVESRTWMRGILDQSRAAHQMHVLMISDELCLERLHRRNTEGTHPFTVSDDLFHQITRHFVPPTPDEGFTLVLHDAPG